MKFPTQQSIKKYPHKVVDGKKVYFMSQKNLPPMNVIKNIYSKISDSKKIPVVFETKEQYLKDYIKNQEKIKNYNFPKKQEQDYLSREKKDMNNIVSRYTTKKNKYIEPRMVFFTDRPMSIKGYRQSIYHEFGHELWERFPSLRKRWSSKIAPTSSPSIYGKTDKEEDFCESYALKNTGYNLDKNRRRIISDVSAQNKRFLTLEQQKKYEEIREKEKNIARWEEEQGREVQKTKYFHPLNKATREANLGRIQNYKFETEDEVHFGKKIKPYTNDEIENFVINSHGDFGGLMAMGISKEKILSVQRRLQFRKGWR